MSNFRISLSNLLNDIVFFGRFFDSLEEVKCKKRNDDDDSS